MKGEEIVRPDVTCWKEIVRPDVTFWTTMLIENGIVRWDEGGCCKLN
jgi:hypothetical protein